MHSRPETGNQETDQEKVLPLGIDPPDVECARKQRNLVPKAGLEPACLAAPPPQDGVSANSTTSAIQKTICWSSPAGPRALLPSLVPPEPEQALERVSRP